MQPRQSVAAARPRSAASYKADPRVYRFLRFLISAALRLVYDYRVTGRENVPPEGPAIVAVNHLHLFDPLVLAPAIPRQVITLAADKWEGKGLVGWFLRVAGTIFIRRGEVDRHALYSCLRVLGEGQVLTIAPEGTRSSTHALQRAKPGIAYLAARSGAPIVPVTVWGTDRLGDWKRLKRPTCRVVVGKPFRLPQIKGRLSTDELQRLADLVMLRIGLELPASYRGVYAERIAAIEAGQSRELDMLR